MKLKTRLFFLICCLFLLLITGCDSTFSDTPETYIGHWECANGDFVTIFPNGKGDLKHGLVCMRGAGVSIDSGEIKMALWGKEETLPIDSEPIEQAGKYSMLLSGVEYQKIVDSATPQ